MRVFIAVLVLVFSLQSWTKADDISDFEIEGMSIGDSLLDFMSITEIKNDLKAQINWPHTDKKFQRVEKYEGSFENYEYVAAIIKPEDPQYIIYGLSGMLDINDLGKKITIGEIAKLLNCSTRTIHRNMDTTLKREKELLNKQL